MAQTPCIKVLAGDVIPDPSTTTRTGGDVVVLGSIPFICLPTDPNRPGSNSLDTHGVYDVPKDSSTFSAGDAVYWATAGNPVLGTAGTGAATSTASGNYLMGLATADAATGDNYVRVKLTAAKRTTTIAGSVTADDITGSDSSLGIAGQAAAQGGAVAIAGGTSSTSGNAGGAVTVTGGTPGATGVGGAVTLAAGAGGATSGNGGVASLTGGAGTNGNATGGVASVTGGAGQGSAAGGVGKVVGGAGGATGAGGAAQVTGGAGGATSGTGGAVAIAGGAGTNGNANGGAVTINGGAKNGSGANGTVTIQSAYAPVAGGGTSAAILCTSTAALGIYFGTGTPTFAAAQGSLYCKTDASTSSTRLYVATDGSGTWSAFTSAA